MEIIKGGDRRRAALDKLRAERTATLQQIEQVTNAPLSLEEVVAKVVAAHGAQAERAERSALDFARPGLDPDSLKFDTGFAIWLLADDFGQYLRAKLKDKVPATAMSEDQRAKKIASLRARVAELELQEEREICRLESAELVVDRRGDVDVEMVLRVWDELDVAAVQP